MQRCQQCQTVVIPKRDGTCPSCGRRTGLTLQPTASDGAVRDAGAPVEAPGASLSSTSRSAPSAAAPRRQKPARGGFRWRRWLPVLAVAGFVAWFYARHQVVALLLQPTLLEIVAAVAIVLVFATPLAAVYAGMWPTPLSRWLQRQVDRRWMSTGTDRPRRPHARSAEVSALTWAALAAGVLVTGLATASHHAFPSAANEPGLVVLVGAQLLPSLVALVGAYWIHFTPRGSRAAKYQLLLTYVVASAPPAAGAWPTAYLAASAFRVIAVVAICDLLLGPRDLRGGTRTLVAAGGLIASAAVVVVASGSWFGLLKLGPELLLSATVALARWARHRPRPPSLRAAFVGLVLFLVASALLPATAPHLPSLVGSDPVVLVAALAAILVSTWAPLGWALLRPGAAPPADAIALYRVVFRIAFPVVLITTYLGQIELLALYLAARYWLGETAARHPVVYLRAFRYESTASALALVVAPVVRGRAALVGLTHESQPPAVVHAETRLDAHAALELAADQEWQTRVREMLESATAAVLDLSLSTRSLQWELEQAQLLLGRERVIVLANGDVDHGLSELAGEIDCPVHLYRLDAIGVREARAALARWLDRVLRMPFGVAPPSDVGAQRP